tara:strand:+ start:2826 stop:3494 length:669 start_codon:yes stop_codon:yes gene_type:complete
MKKLLLTFFALTYLGLGLGAGVANAQEFSVSSGAQMSSDYFWRGVSQNAGKTALSSNLDVSYGAFTTGIWASQVDFGTNDNFEYDIYASVGHTVFDNVFGGIGLETGIIRYAYDGDTASTNEVFLGGNVGPVSATYWKDLDGDAGYWQAAVAGPSYKGFGTSVEYGRQVDGLWSGAGDDYYALNVSYDIADNVAFNAKVFDFVETDSTYMDGISVSIGYTFN